MPRKLVMAKTITDDIKSAVADSFKDSIRMIEVSKIKASIENFYTIDDIETLADDIERQGLKHNLVVTEDINNPGTYFIKSGHRRFAAVNQLISENRYKSKFIPCLVDGKKSKNETMLDLIMLNATTRVMSDSELYKQYEFLKNTLDAMKEEGIKVKGRLREKISVMLNISTGQVSKIENIKHNAVGEVQEAVENGEMTITTADTIAQLPEEEQRDLLAQKEISEISTKDVKEHKKNKSKKSETSATKKKSKSKTKNVTDDDEFAAEKEKFLSVLRNAVIDAEKSNSLDTLHDIMKFTKEKIEI
mgnify:CR=1 FL=1